MAASGDLAPKEARWGVRQLVLLGLASLLLFPVLFGVGSLIQTAFEVGGFTVSQKERLIVALRVSIISGLGAALFSLGISLALTGLILRIKPGRRISQLLLPAMAAPHAAIAVGLAFLIAPSGWIFRFLSPWATGWEFPPDVRIVGDAYGFALMAGLVVKEVPFLILLMLAQASKLPLKRLTDEGLSLGYRWPSIWLRLIFPALYPLVRMPLFIVLAFSLSVVDMAIILGPSSPPSLALLAMRGLVSPDLEDRSFGAFSAALVLLLAGMAIILWICGEKIIAWLGRAWLFRGSRSGPERMLFALSALSGGGTVLAGLFALLLMMLWSVSWRWSFPDVLPESYSLQAWRFLGKDWFIAAGNTLLLGIASVGLSLLAVILWLELSWQRNSIIPKLEPLLYTPLIIPQIAFLHGVAALFLQLELLAQGWVAALLGHILFVFPYMLLALATAWRRLDHRFLAQGAALGAGGMRRLIRLRLPMLATPIFIACAIGFSVSVAQFLPSLILGGGRVETLTTKTVALASGGDRRLVAALGMSQAILPLIGFALALSLPALLWRDRRDMRGGGEI